MASTDEKLDAKPNILITGTPGVGKSYICERLAEQMNFKWIDCSKLAREQNFIDEYDIEYACPILDEDSLLDYMEPQMQKGGNIVEYHSCEFFPERWFAAVFVVRCSNTVLYDRLEERGYDGTKLKSNIECEIFGVTFDEARNSFKHEIVFELSGETEIDAENSIKTVKNWCNEWKKK